MPGLLRARVGLRPRVAEDARREATATTGWSPARRCGRRFAHYAKWCMLVARTDPDAPEAPGAHLLPDGHGAGRASRSGRCVQITGEAEFNEIFMDEARIPDENVVGGVGNGWAVAITTLMNERAGPRLRRADRASQQRRSASSIELARATPRNGGIAADDPVVRQRLAQLYIEVRDLARSTPTAGLTKIDADGHPRPRGLARQVAVGRDQPGT